MCSFFPDSMAWKQSSCTKQALVRETKKVGSQLFFFFCFHKIKKIKRKKKKFQPLKSWRQVQNVWNLTILQATWNAKLFWNCVTILGMCFINKCQSLIVGLAHTFYMQIQLRIPRFFNGAFFLLKFKEIAKRKKKKHFTDKSCLSIPLQNGKYYSEIPWYWNFSFKLFSEN